MVSKTSSTYAPHGVRQVIRLSAGRIRRLGRSCTERRSVDASGRPRDAEVGSDLLEAVDDFRIQRDSFFAEPLHPCEALLSVNVDPLLTVRFRTLFQLARNPTHVPSELVLQPERPRIQSHEEMSDVRLLLLLVDLQP